MFVSTAKMNKPCSTIKDISDAINQSNLRNFSAYIINSNIIFLWSTLCIERAFVEVYNDMCYIELLNSIVAAWDPIHYFLLLVTSFKLFTNDCNDLDLYACFYSFLINGLNATF